MKKTIASTRTTRRYLYAAIAVGIGSVLSTPAFADDSGHTLVVDDVEYDSYQHSGAAIHWETPDVDPTEAGFAERNQTWTGHGSEHLPCPGGIHWISNENILTVSHCLEEYPPSTTTASTSTTAPTSTSTPASSTSAAPTTAVTAPTTTAPESTSTSSPTTSIDASTTTSTTTPPTQPSTTSSPTSGPSTTVALIEPPLPPECSTGVVVNGVCQPVGIGLPATGWNPWRIIIVAFLAVGFGWMIANGFKRR